jgi:Cu-Zn family superoxide dismutase
MPVRSGFLILAIGATAVAGCESLGQVPTERLGSARLMLANGLPAGTVQLIGNGETLSLVVAAAGLPEGQHGFHLHTVGRCDQPDFTSAGPHLNPAGNRHGLDNPQGPHLGDLPNLTVSLRGTAAATIALRGTQAQLLEQLFDSDGTSVIVHAQPDDGSTEPTGNAGARIACGLLTGG